MAAEPVPSFDFAAFWAAAQARIAAVGYIWAPEDALTACPLCRVALPDDRHPAHEGLEKFGCWVRWQVCEEARAWFLNPRLSDAQTAQFYGEGWYRRLIAAFHGNPREDESGTLLNIQRKYGQWVCARLAELILGGKIAPLWGGVLDSPQRLPRILDVGASSGALGAQLGGILTGLDPALGEGEGPACDRAIRATLESVTDEELQPPFDLIICAQTLDHLRDPRGGLERMRNWLVPKGVLWVDILDVKADLRLRGHLRWVRKLDHNFGFLPYSLRWLLDKTGYEMVSETPWRGHCMRHHFGVLARRKP